MTSDSHPTPETIHYYAGWPAKTLCEGATLPVSPITSIRADHVTCAACKKVLNGEYPKNEVITSKERTRRGHIMVLREILHHGTVETGAWEAAIRYAIHKLELQSPDETADDPLEHSKVILDEILAERGRQVTRLGWTPQHDDEHDDRSLARAAATYVLHYTHRAVFAKSDPSAYQEEAGAMDAACWPDGWEFKPKSPHRDLIRAAALIVAELERLDRSSSQKADDGLVKRGGAIDSSEHKR